MLKFRYAHGTIPSLITYDPVAFMASTTPNAPYTLYSLISGVWIPLNEPFKRFGPFQFFIPVQFGTSLATISGASTSFMGIELDLAAGVGVHYYTRSFVRIDLEALYRIAFPLEDFSASGNSLAVVQDPYGETMKLSTAGFEIRAGVSFMLPQNITDPGAGAK